jgi:hypothetical protein
MLKLLNETGATLNHVPVLHEALSPQAIGIGGGTMDALLAFADGPSLNSEQARGCSLQAFRRFGFDQGNCERVSAEAR